MKIKTVIIVLGILLPILSVRAQDIRPLSIGDTVPDLVLHNVINYKDSVIRLSDFKDKSYIIYFWGRYCIPCIEKLPELDSINRQPSNPKIILVIDYDSVDELKKFLKKIRMDKLTVPIALHSNVLDSLFPHMAIPHVAWIYKGQVKSISDGDQLIKSNIARFVRNNNLLVPLKQEDMEYDYQSPLLSLHKSNTSNTAYLYSTFSEYIPGLTTRRVTTRDRNNRYYCCTYYNTPVYAFCQIAFGVYGDSIRYRWQVRDSTRYTPPCNMSYSEWLAKNAYNFSYRLPLSFSVQQRNLFQKEQILQWLRIYFGIEVSLGYENNDLRHPTYTLTQKEIQ